MVGSGTNILYSCVNFIQLESRPATPEAKEISCGTILSYNLVPSNERYQVPKGEYLSTYTTRDTVLKDLIALKFLYYLNDNLPWYDLLFALFVWCKMAIKIENNTSTVKYAYLFFINIGILSLVTLTFPLGRIWNFVLFETILISLNNKEKRIKFFCCRISGRLVIIFSVIYHLFFNWLGIFSLIIKCD